MNYTKLSKNIFRVLHSGKQEKGVEKFLEKVKTIIETKKSIKQESLIRVLNPIITDWSKLL